jgi:light-independent protochlorophyllide reductase subunit B
LPWYSRSVDSTYLTGKRVFIFRRRHPCRRRRPHRSDELGFRSSDSAPTAANSAVRCARPRKLTASKPLITDDYLEVEAKVAELQPELVLGTQMERHIAKRSASLRGDLGAGACAGFSGPLLPRRWASRAPT